MSKKKQQQDEPGDAPAADAAPRVVAHPRARVSIRRWRGRAGLAALALCLFLSLRAGLPAFDAVARALVAGIAAQFIAWFAGLVLWRHLILGELAAHRALLEAARAERAAARAAAE